MNKDDFTHTYKLDTRIRDKYNQGFVRRDDEVTHLIVHGTGGGRKAEDCIKWMINGGDLGGGKSRESQYRRGVALFQFLIDRDGTVIELLNPHKWVYHSSTMDFDRHTIGVELINPDRSNGGHYTDNQYLSLVQLYTFLRERFRNMYYITGHGSIKRQRTNKTKACPGDGFNWKVLNLDLTKDGGFTTVYGSEEINVL